MRSSAHGEKELPGLLVERSCPACWHTKDAPRLASPSWPSPAAARLVGPQRAA
ncbi:hypothetical protein Droror1_Dr00006422, partial [Drosera rotundifolia]